MAAAVEKHWRGPLEGLVVTRVGHGAPTKRIRVVEAGHPNPDAAGMAAAGEILAMVHGLTSDDLVLALISGGGSALLSLPGGEVTLADKQAITRALLKSGARIGEMNIVRKHLSAIKGGRLAIAAAPASVVTLILSDVPGDDLSVIASGPTVRRRQHSRRCARGAGALPDRCPAARRRPSRRSLERDAEARRPAALEGREPPRRDAARLAPRRRGQSARGRLCSAHSRRRDRRRGARMRDRSRRHRARAPRETANRFARLAFSSPAARRR